MNSKFWNINHEPGPHNGLLLVALGGENDAALAATRALEHLRTAAGAGMFAYADADSVFCYSGGMPLMTHGEDGKTSIRWPELELFRCGTLPAAEDDGMVPAAEDDWTLPAAGDGGMAAGAKTDAEPGMAAGAKTDAPKSGTDAEPGTGSNNQVMGHGPLFMSGRRPDLNLMSFSEELGRLLSGWGVRHVVHLTSGFAQAVHTMPTRVCQLGTVPGNDPESPMAQEIREIESRTCPDGAGKPLQDGALAYACLQAGLSYTAICGLCPGYLNGGVNEQAAAELARRGQAAAMSPGDLGAAGEVEREYLKLLNSATERNPQFRIIVEMAERQVRSLDEKASHLEPGESDAVADELEEFLKQERERGGN